MQQVKEALGGRRLGTTNEDMRTMPREDQEGRDLTEMGARERGPVAEIRVQLLSLADGEAEIEVAIDPNGELAAAYGEGDEREDAYQRLYDTVQRELGDALRVLAEGEPAPS